MQRISSTNAFYGVRLVYLASPHARTLADNQTLSESPHTGGLHSQMTKAITEQFSSLLMTTEDPGAHQSTEHSGMEISLATT